MTTTPNKTPVRFELTAAELQQAAGGLMPLYIRYGDLRGDVTAEAKYGG
jgi:hypothetical protein